MTLPVHLGRGNFYKKMLDKQCPSQLNLHSVHAARTGRVVKVVMEEVGRVFPESELFPAEVTVLVANHVGVGVCAAVVLDKISN
jgi:hypothetical protein